MHKLYQKLLETDELALVLVFGLLFLSVVVLGTVEYVTTMIIELNK